MTTTEYAVTAFIILMAVFGIVEAIRTPMIVRRFYRDKSFVDNGKSTLDEVSDSVVLNNLYTPSLNSAVINGVTVQQFKAWSLQRRQFTLSKATRKRNQIAWSVTIVNAQQSLTPFCARPTVVPEAIIYVNDGKGIEFHGDDEFANRYHVVTERADIIRPLLTEKIREFLLQPEAISVEVIKSGIIVKRQWQADKVLDRLQQEIDIALAINDWFVSRQQ